MIETVTFLPWLRANLVGWILGIVLVVLLALVGDVVGVSGVQFLVGLGMGLGVGAAQARVLKAVLGESSSWRRASTIGLALPFLIADAANAAGVFPYSPYATIAAAGLSVGLFQARLLSPRTHASLPWVVANLSGWAAAGFMAFVADTVVRSAGFRGISGALLYLTLVASGGIVLGLSTAAALRTMLPASFRWRTPPR